MKTIIFLFMQLIMIIILAKQIIPACIRLGKLAVAMTKRNLFTYMFMRFIMYYLDVKTFHLNYISFIKA